MSASRSLLLLLAFISGYGRLGCLCSAFSISPPSRVTGTGTGQDRNVFRYVCGLELKASTDTSADELAHSKNDHNDHNSPKKVEDDDSSDALPATSITSEAKVPPPPVTHPLIKKKKMELMWCGDEACQTDLREGTVGEHNQILLHGPATAQVAFHWGEEESYSTSPLNNNGASQTTPMSTQQHQAQATQCVLILVKQGSDNDALLTIAGEAVQTLTAAHKNLQILLDPGTAARLKHYHGVDGDQIHLFEAQPCAGFGVNLLPADIEATESGSNSAGCPIQPLAAGQYTPDLILTLGGDGLLMHAGMLFQGPMPPILCVSGGSLGFLTPFQPTEMAEAVQIVLGLKEGTQEPKDIQVFPPNSGYSYEPEETETEKRHNFSLGLGNYICLSIRMRLDCRIINREGAIRARYNVLNEVVIDRGSSPFLAALECFCDDSHLTTVQADGVIFATPTGSTAYSLAAGSSVVHPAVPCILLTPICPHVLSFRSMVFPDHVVLRCYVPDDARSEASVAFDGKHRQELHRGDSVQIQMSAYPVPTINRRDHSADWLTGLKRSFNFNGRARQRPL